MPADGKAATGKKASGGTDTPTPVALASATDNVREPKTGVRAGSEITVDTVRLMIEASARTTKAEIETLLSSRLAKLDHMPSTPKMIWAVVGGVVTATTIIVGVFAYASDRFDGGVGLGTEIGTKFAENRIEIERNATRDAETRESVDRLIERMDQLIERLGEPPE